MLHQFRRGLPLNRVIPSHHWVDGINEFQVRERSTMGNEEVVARLAEVAAMAVVGRRRLPPPIRWAPVPMGPPIGWKPLTYLMRMGFTRDVWMHRVDLARATRREIVLTPQHDGRLVADIVVEWANRHGEPFRLELTGPAGGTYVQEGAGEHLTLDAVEFCRVLSGRAFGIGLLRHNSCRCDRVASAGFCTRRRAVSGGGNHRIGISAAVRNLSRPNDERRGPRGDPEHRAMGLTDGKDFRMRNGTDGVA
jgi:hypothetical protein